MWDWVQARVTEVSTWSGGALIAVGCVILFAGPFAKMAALVAIGWGIFSLIKKN